jgi:hypothetical protein
MAAQWEAKAAELAANAKGRLLGTWAQNPGGGGRRSALWLAG